MRLSVIRGSVAAVLLFVTAAGLVSGQPGAHAAGSSANVPAILFSADSRIARQYPIYTANADGSHVHAVTPANGDIYSWPRFAFRNTKIVFTQRHIYSKATSIRLMNLDGSDVRTIASFEYPVGQPLIDAAGRWLYYTAEAPWYYHTALFKMDLHTLQSRNLTSVSTPLYGTDSDPSFTPPNNQRIVTIHGLKGHAIVVTMSLDGAARRTLLDDAYFNTDPTIAPDGLRMAAASYRAHHGPRITTSDFNLIERDLRTGHVRVLTQGDYCAGREPSNPCTVPQMSAYQPRYTNDGNSIAFAGALDNLHTCICAIGHDGTHPRVLLEQTDIAIVWFDLRRPDSGSTAGIRNIGIKVPRSRVLLVSAPASGGVAQLFSASPDLIHRTVLPLPKRLVPMAARWGPNGSVVFTAQVPIPRASKKNPPASGRHVLPRALARQQVFLRYANGRVRQLTTPQTGHRYKGDLNANEYPSLAPDGRTVFVTSVSTTTSESWIVKVDVRTRHARNLSLPHLDGAPSGESLPVVSRDGRRVAFARVVGRYSVIYTMDTRTGAHLKAVSSAHGHASWPAWTPDSRYLVYVVARKGGLGLARTRLHGGRTVPLAAGRHSTLIAPVVDPQQLRVLFVGTSVNTLDVFVSRAAGGGTALHRQSDPIVNILFVDWK